MRVKSFLLIGLCLASGSLFAAPHDLKGKTFDMTGTIKVKGRASCGGFSGGGAGESPVNGNEIGATITFPDSDLEGGSFLWSNDDLMPEGATAVGNIGPRTGNKLELNFGDDAANAFFQMAQIDGANGHINQGGAQVEIKYGATAVAAKDKLKVTEKVTFTVVAAPCKFKWTVSRVLKGPVVPEPI